MQNATFFKNKLEKGKICLGTSITFSDACLTEVLCPALDFVWIDMEHNALSLEVVQAHIMATKGTQTTALVRVTWNDPALIKPVLDIGADGIIVPMIRTSEDVRRAVAACLLSTRRNTGVRSSSSLGLRPPGWSRVLPGSQPDSDQHCADRAHPSSRKP